MPFMFPFMSIKRSFCFLIWVKFFANTRTVFSSFRLAACFISVMIFCSSRSNLRCSRSRSRCPVFSSFFICLPGSGARGLAMAGKVLAIPVRCAGNGKNGDGLQRTAGEERSMRIVRKEQFGNTGARGGTRCGRGCWCTSAGPPGPDRSEPGRAGPPRSDAGPPGPNRGPKPGPNRGPNRAERGPPTGGGYRLELERRLHDDPTNVCGSNFKFLLRYQPLFFN